MVENEFYVVPATPERIEHCSRSPPPSVRDFLKAQQKTTTALAAPAAARNNAENDGENSNGSSSSRNENAETSSGGGSQQQRDGAQSPQNCAICLGKISSICFTDSCMHQFCFSCLLEWSKIKAECPLCKQSFKSIIHNVTSMDKYDEYKVQQLPSWITNLEQYILNFPRYRDTFEHSRMYHLFLQENELTLRFAREYANDSVPSRSSGSQWRAYVYHRRIYALPLLDYTGRSRDISARFYRENPAQIHRLMPWLNREIIWLLSNTEHYITMVLRTLEDLLLTYDITSVSFRRRVQTYFHRYTSHFIHELINYARSPYDLLGYDRNVQYSPYFEDEVQSIGSSDDESLLRLSNSDSESSNDVTETRTTIQQRLNNSSLIVYNNSISVNSVGSIGGGSGSGSGSGSGVVAATGTGESSRALGAIVDRLAAHTSRPIESVELESDDSDEIMFVGEQKPPHLRTPEMVELNSESDSDVMFVEDENPTQRTEVESIRTSKPSATAVENRCDKRKASASRDLNSTSSLTLAKRKYEVNKKESDRETSPASPTLSTPSSASSMSSSSSSTVTSSSTSTSSSSYSSMTPSSSSAASTSSSTVIKTEKKEYNSMENDSRRYHSVIKQYARPKRRHTSKKHSKKRAAKTIYDPDTSNSDASDDDDNSNDSYANSSRNSSSSSSESSHEEFTVGRASSSRKKSKSSRKKMDRKKKRKSKRKSMSSSASSATSSKPKRKITKLCIKREKNANYRLVDKYYDDENENDDDDDDDDDEDESTRSSFNKSRHQHHLTEGEDDD